MTLPYAMTRQACRVHRALPGKLKARVDKRVLGLRLVPTFGDCDPDRRQFRTQLRTDTEIVQIHYRLVDAPAPQLVVVSIRSFPLPAAATTTEQLREAVPAG